MTVAERHPILARDVARSYIAMGVTVVLALALFFGALYLAPIVFSGMDVPQVVWLFYYTAWTVYCVVYIVLSLIAFLRLDAASLRSLTSASDPGPDGWRRLWWSLNGGGAITWALTGSGVTLAALVFTAVSRDGLSPIVLTACVTVVIATVALIIVAFAVNYARENAVNGGLDFPGEYPPRFGDYLYLSIQLTTTFGGSDVEVTMRRMRRIVSMHSLIAFTFNTVIVALLVSVLVGRLT